MLKIKDIISITYVDEVFRGKTVSHFLEIHVILTNEMTYEVILRKQKDGEVDTYCFEPMLISQFPIASLSTITQLGQKYDLDDDTIEKLTKDIINHKKVKMKFLFLKTLA
jgi:hypothetical protein